MNNNTASALSISVVSLTDAQMGIWLADHISQQRNTFTIAHKVHINGDVQSKYLLEAIEIGLQEADTINAIYREQDGVPTQGFNVTPLPVLSEWFDYTNHADGMAQMEFQIQRDLESELSVSSSAPLTRQMFFKLADEHYVWYQRFHHIMLDGFSFNALTSRIASIYNALIHQRNVTKCPYTPFEEVVKEELAYKQSEKYDQDKAFWKTYCADLPQVTSLAKEPAMYETVLASSQLLIRLDSQVSSVKLQVCLNSLESNKNLAVADLAIGLVAAFLMRVTDQWCLPIGFPFMGRVGSTALQALGPVVNVLPLIAEGQVDYTIFDLTRRIKKDLRSARKHQKYNGEQISRDLNRVGEALYGPTINLRLFDYELAFGGAPAKIEHLAAGPVDDLDFGIHFEKDTVHIEWAANSQKYTQAELEGYVARFDYFIANIVANPHLSLAEFSTLLEPEQQQIQRWQCGDLLPDIPYSSVIEKFHSLDDSLSSETALVVGNNHITFAELNCNIAKWAQALQVLGVERGACVGLALPRDERIVYAMFATMTLGAHYLPIDPTYPQDRINWMIEDSAPKLVLTCSGMSFELPKGALIQLVNEDTFLTLLSACHDEKCSVSTFPKPSDLAYIMYTSGSTGKPKGVVIAHQGLMNLSRFHWSRDGEALTDKYQQVNVLLTASFSFDTNWDILYWLCFGHTVHIVADDISKDPELIKHYCQEQNIQAVDLPPTVLTQLFDLDAIEPNQYFPSLIYIGGEAASSRLWQQARSYPELKIRNYYGPTENTVDSLGADVMDSEKVIIGRPLYNTEAYILDSSLSPVAIGIPGELYVSGPGLAHGYLNQPALTSARFVANPFKEGERMYRTGDLARWLDDGQVEFIGRTDHQVQIRGHRVEPSEVEVTINQLNGVKNCLVVANKQGSTHRLDAYLIVEESAIEDGLGEIKRLTQSFFGSLSNLLPAYMIPATLTLLPRFPLNTNGKVDRGALPSPVSIERQGTPPKNEQETLICQLVQEVLNLDVVFADDDFFALGGDSIVAMSLSSLARKNGFSLRAKDIFESRIVSVIAGRLTPLDQKKMVSSVTTGQLSELPIYRWMYQSGGLNLPYYQSVSIALPNEMNYLMFSRLVDQLVAAHTILNGVVDSTKVTVGEAPDSFPVNLFTQQKTFSALLDTAFEELIQTPDEAAFSAMKVAYLQGEQQNAAVFALHHTIVDGVSWRVLFTDIARLLDNVESPLDASPNSLLDWQTALKNDMLRWQKELPHWQTQLAAEPLFKGKASSSKGHQRLSLDIKTSALLLDALPKQYRCQPQEAFLSALYLAFADQYQVSDIPIMMESHGRAEIGGLDLTRTVGWFTAEYPIRMSAPRALLKQLNHLDAPYESVVRLVRSSLQKVPHNGVGYGVLKHFNDDSSTALYQGSKPSEPQILFNYLGRFQQESLTLLKGDRYFHDTFEVHQSEQLQSAYTIELNIFIEELEGAPQLVVHLDYDTQQIEEQDANGLISRLSDMASRMTQFANKHQAIAADSLVPEDINSVYLNEQNIESLRNQYGALEAVLPALPLQEGLLFHAQLEQASHAKDAGYSSLARLAFSGEMDIQRLKRSLGMVIEKHPQLGALFDFSQGDKALQILLWRRTSERENWWPLEVVDLKGLDKKTQQSRLLNIEKDELSRDFMALQSSGVPLLHAVLVTFSDEKHYLFLNAHHLVVDGWSTPIMLRDLLKAYASDASKLPATSVPYISVVEQLLLRDKTAMQAAWKEAFSGAEPTLLFADNPPNELVTTHRLTFDEQKFSQLKALYQGRGLTLNSLLQTVWANVLFGLTGHSDVVFGTPISGRFGSVTGIEEHIGLFSNTVPVRVNLQPGSTLWEQMQQVQNEQIALLEHDGLGLSEVQRLVGQSNLFDTLLVVENFPEQVDLFTSRYHGLTLDEVYNRGFTHYPLTILALPSEQLEFLFEYRGGAEIESLIARFDNLLTLLLSDEAAPQHTLDIRLDAEKDLMSSLNNTRHDVSESTLRDCLIQQALATPEQVCLSDESTKLSYQQARHEVICLAKELQRLGVKPGDIVAVALPRSVKLSLALWAIVEVGAAYLPLDTGYPDDRLNYMLEDAKPSALITLESESARFGQEGARYLFDDAISPVQEQTLLDDVMKAWQGPELEKTSAAYLLYTSGSTGRPKGVLVSHQAIVNRILWMQDCYPLTTDDVILQKTPCSFDVSVWEFFWSAMVGASLYMAPPEAHRDPVQLQQLIDEQQITTLHFVPSMLAAFVSSVESVVEAKEQSACGSLQRVFCSGEALPVELSRKFEKIIGCELHNLYGPTEAAVDVTYFPAYGNELAQLSAVGVPIGYPVWNTQVRILDSFLRPVAAGVAGELYLCGVQLAEGYWQRPELCATRFVADVEDNGERMYRTGDVVRWLENGAIEYLGRNDDQLKIRGQRIELGEIEQVLAAQQGVDLSVVVAKEWGQQYAAMGADARQLVAYVTSKQGQLDVVQMRTMMAEQLPTHMVPVAIMQLDDMPLSANGKLDRKALPVPSDRLNGSERRTLKLGVETEIANAFSKVLGITGLSATDDFFTLGGHSILAVRLAAELRKALKLNVTVGQVMVSPSIEKLAQVLSNQDLSNSRELSGFGPVLPIKQGIGNPIFCIHSASGFAWQYTGFARYVSQECSMIGLQSPRPDGPIAAQKTMDGVIDQHLNILKSRQPTGPYRIVGYSLGGVIAHGLAVRLQKMGEQVDFLGLLDTYPPDDQDWSGAVESEAQEEVEREKEQFMNASGEVLDQDMEKDRDTMFADIVANYADSVMLLSATKSKRFNGKAVLFVADNTVPEGMDIQATWAPYVDELEEHHFNFAHEDIISPEALVVLGPIFKQLIEQ